jgi:type II secretory pathway component PulJ
MVARKRAGFTLAEVCVASALMALVFVAVLGTISVGRRSASLVENRLAALHIARATMEDLRRHLYGSPELAEGTTLLPGNRGRYVVTSAGDGSTKDVAVHIDWVEPDGDVHTVSLTTSFTRSLHR